MSTITDSAGADPADAGSLQASAHAPLHPRLRALDVRPYTHNGNPYLLLRDPHGLTEQSLLVPQPLASALALCDGTRDLPTIQREFAARHGVHIHVKQIREMVETLDEALMLENRRAAVARMRAVDEYRSQPFRVPYLAGPSYPAEPTKLRALINQYLSGVSATNGHHNEHQNGYKNGTAPAPVCGLLSPHIDYPRGGSVYATVWQRAAQAAREADLVIMFGTDHYGSDPFTLTRQKYATPYGVLPTALDVVDALAETLGDSAAYRGELRHRGEHSLELVTTWLHHVRDEQPCEMVPILCGGFHRFIRNGGEPESDAAVAGVLETLRDVTRDRRVLVVASGDLAHVGPAFGGRALDDDARRVLRHADDGLLSAMAAGDAGEFFQQIRNVRDGNNVCGVSPIYLTMRLLEMTGGPICGEQTGYATCPADNVNTSVVTVGGVVFT